MTMVMMCRFLPDGPLGTVGLLAGMFLLSVAWHMGAMSYRLLTRAPGAVRAHKIVGDPVSSIRILITLIRAHFSNTLPAAFDALFPSPSVHTVETSMLGLSERIILTRDPVHIRALLSTGARSGVFGKGHQFRGAWHDFLGAGSVFTADGAEWRAGRALLRPVFARERLGAGSSSNGSENGGRDLIAICHRCVDLMLDTTMPAGSGQTVDVMDLFYRMALDITTDFLLGQSVGSLENPQHGFAKAFADVQRAQMLLTILAPYKSIVPKKKYRDGIEILDAFVEPFITQALSVSSSSSSSKSDNDDDTPPPTTFLLSIAQSTRDPRVLRDQIMSILLAGRDTTAATLSWAVYELSRHPSAWAKLRAQVLSVTQEPSPTATTPTTASPTAPTPTIGPLPPTYEQLKKIPYLKHVLNETLRLHPVLPFNTRTALADTTLPSTAPGQPDIAVLEGDTIFYSTLAMQRRRDLYPDVLPSSSSSSDTFADPDVFSPERWEDGSWTPAPWQFIPFSGGPRVCVGQDFAMTEMGFCLARLVQRYERVEYRGDWDAQFLKVEIVGSPGQGVPVAFFEPDGR